METQIQGECGAEVFLGQSPAAARLRLQVERFAPHFRIVLLTGEAGSGKRTVAERLHHLSPAAGKLMVLSGTAWAEAQGSCMDATLYLPGLESLRLSAQEQLLGRLRAGWRENRVIVGCAADPRGLLAAGRLRADVLERLGTLEIRVPALRDRREDLPHIASAMLTRLESQHAWLAEHCAAVHGRAWEQNLRELATLCAGLNATGKLPAEHAGARQADAPVRLDDVLQHHVRTVIERCAGNKLKAAELLGISRSTLYRMLESAVNQAEI